MLHISTFFSASLFQQQELFQIGKKPKNMGTCPIKFRSSRPILETPPEPVGAGRFNPHSKLKQEKCNRSNCIYYIHVIFPSVGLQESAIISLHNYPSLGHTELAMCIGERLTIISEYVR